MPDILDMKGGPGMHKSLVSKGLGGDSDAFERLDRLHRAIHSDAVIHSYLEENQDLDHVLDVFIRVNSGGTVLSFSDLLLSIATAEWDDTDARETIHGLVDELNQTGRGFGFSKDFVLKAGLMLADIASVGFRVTNFNKVNMQVLRECWPKVAQALRLAARLVADFGFSRDNLTADSPLLFIAYYLYRRDVAESYLSATAQREDRAAIRSWLVRSLLKPGVWGSGLDASLTALRTVIKSHGSTTWPSDELVLDGPLNQAKSDLLPADWVGSQYPTAGARAAYLERHDLGEFPPGMPGFPDFFAARRRLMRDRLRALLGSPGR